MDDSNIKFYETLKDKRKTKKISLKEISEYTKINISYLESLENGDFEVLPTVYTRLFLRSYCDYVGVDSKQILDEYQIHTVGSAKKQTSIADLTMDTPDSSNQDKDTKKTAPIPVGISRNMKKSKDVIISIIVIAIIIAVFLIIYILN
tara:strand:+ start:768 stop:1211 length:444 start_codon:yes stop_codon:yes gene_type:complete